MKSLKLWEQLFRTLVDPILATPGTGFISVRESAQTLFLTFTPEYCDYGRIIGKNGQNFTTLKTLLEGVRKTVRLTILEPAAGPEKPKSVTPNPNWTPGEISKRIEFYLSSLGECPELQLFRERESWRIVPAARLEDPDTAEALRRWVSIMAVSTGGRALYDDERLAV